MSRAGPAAALALKTQSGLSAGDNDPAATAAAGMAHRAAAAAKVATPALPVTVPSPCVRLLLSAECSSGS
jgi:hypothetical protein